MNRDDVPEVQPGDVWRYGEQPTEYTITGRTESNTGWRTNPGTFFFDEQFKDGRLSLIRRAKERP